MMFLPFLFWVLIFCFVCFVFYLLLVFLMKHTIESFKSPQLPFHLQTWIINLDKNKDRLNQSMANYTASDLSIVPIQRYSAIVGKNLNPEDYLSEYALNEFQETNTRKYRTRHYQLTQGGIGCFLSHMNLYKQLLQDKTMDYYLILEDDIKIDKHAYAKIKALLQNPPDNWDMILVGYNRIFNSLPSMDETSLCFEVKSFWGTCGYLINQQGAQKLVNAYTTMDCQIDSFMSWLAIKHKLTIFTLNPPIVVPDSFYTDIQINLFPVNQIDAFMYHDVYLGNK